MECTGVYFRHFVYAITSIYMIIVPLAWDILPLKWVSLSGAHFLSEENLIFKDKRIVFLKLLYLAVNRGHNSLSDGSVISFFSHLTHFRNWSLNLYIHTLYQEIVLVQVHKKYTQHMDNPTSPVVTRWWFIADCLLDITSGSFWAPTSALKDAVLQSGSKQDRNLLLRGTITARDTFFFDLWGFKARGPFSSTNRPYA